ncbi:hypothetical protein MMC19_001289 [Ptychographa xylographoides]|nr:hypothetical protein [Ptychographa xylographoides]
MAVALSTGLIELYCMHLGRLSEYSLLSKEESDGAQRGRVRVSEPSILVLSLAWHPNVPAVIAASLSNGNIVLVDCSKDISIRQIEAHSLEAWTVSWSPNVSHLQRQDELTLFSGGDDSTLRTFGKPLEEQAKSPDDPVKLRPILFPDARIHGAGITAILPLQLWKDIEDVEDEVLLTGSYDEHIRVLLLGPNRRWKVAAEERLGGGVWRLSMMSRSQIREKASNMGASFQILASCMHAGARVLNVFLSSDETWSIKIIAKFEEHESMNYGSDALVWDGHIAGGDTPFTVASTSFYDRKLCLWKAPNTNATHPAVGQ